MTSRRKRRVTAESDPTQSTWTVRGVTHETRQAVVIAARRRGMTVGAFVDHALREAAAAVIQGTPLPAPRQEELLEAVLSQLREMNERNATVEARLGALETRRSWWRRWW